MGVMHVIIDAQRTLSDALLPVLLSHQKRVRIVSGSSVPVDGAEVYFADMFYYEQVVQATKGAHVVYFLTPLEERSEYAVHDCMHILSNVVNACKEHGARLIFLDTAWVYGKFKGLLNEDSVMQATGRRGRVAAAMAAFLQSEMKQFTVQVAIARVALIYGPGYPVAQGGNIIFRDLLADDSVVWSPGANIPCAFHYAPDVANAMYMLTETPLAMGQVWNLPTPMFPLTAQQFVQLAATQLGKRPRLRTLPRWGYKLYSIIARRDERSGYCCEAPFLIDSSKFERAFLYHPTSYKEGVVATAAWFLNTYPV